MIEVTFKFKVFTIVVKVLTVIKVVITVGIVVFVIFTEFKGLLHQCGWWRV